MNEKMMHRVYLQKLKQGVSVMILLRTQQECRLLFEFMVDTYRFEQVNKVKTAIQFSHSTLRFRNTDGAPHNLKGCREFIIAGHEAFHSMASGKRREFDSIIEHNNGRFPNGENNQQPQN